MKEKLISLVAEVSIGIYLFIG